MGPTTGVAGRDGRPQTVACRDRPEQLVDDGTLSAAPILTPDQRLRVFVSSTLEELADERRAVARAISALRLTPVMFESGARPHPPRRLYEAYVAQSDIFIGLYWEHYGWVAPDMQLSGLEDEFDLSRSLPRKREPATRHSAPFRCRRSFADGSRTRRRTCR